MTLREVKPLPSNIPRGDVIVTGTDKDDPPGLTEQTWQVWSEAPGVDRVWIGDGKTAHCVDLARLRTPPTTQTSIDD